jgi:hypothetical protein
MRAKRHEEIRKNYKIPNKMTKFEEIFNRSRAYAPKKSFSSLGQANKGVYSEISLKRGGGG